MIKVLELVAEELLPILLEGLEETKLVIGKSDRGSDIAQGVCDRSCDRPCYRPNPGCDRPCYQSAPDPGCDRPCYRT